MDVTRPLRCRACGVTLVEVLATCTVALVVTAAAVPAVRQFSASQDTSAALNAVHGDLLLARHAAITRAQRVVLCPSSDAQTCSGDFDWSVGWIVFVDSDCDRQRDEQEPLLRVQQARRQGMRILTSTGRRKLVYRSDGGTGGSNATFRFCHRDRPDHNRSIIVSNTGRPRHARLDASGKSIRCN